MVPQADQALLFDFGHEASPTGGNTPFFRQGAGNAPDGGRGLLIQAWTGGDAQTLTFYPRSKGVAAVPLLRWVVLSQGRPWNRDC